MNQHVSLRMKLRHLLPAALAVMAMGVAMPSHATNAALPQSNTGETMGMAQDGVAAAPVDHLTRAEVRESLMNARAAGLLTPNGEIGDTTEVLQRREDFYALQTEVLQAEYKAAALREERAQFAASQQAEQIAQLMQGADTRVMTTQELNAWPAEPATGGGMVLLVIEEK